MNYHIVRLTKSLESAAWDFLAQYPDSSVLLAGNLLEQGPDLIAGNIRSGNFKCILQGEAIVAVFCLNLAGELMLETDRRHDYAKLIVESCLTEPVAFTCVEAEWKLAEGIWRELIEIRPDMRTREYSREVFYRLLLDTTFKAQDRQGIRMLVPEDFAAWDVLQSEYYAEQKMVLPGNVEQRQSTFNIKVERRCIWGLFSEQTLIGTAILDSMTRTAAQIRGVHIRPCYRRQGHGRRLLACMVEDSWRIHGLERLLLFTEVGNKYARRIYHALGFQEIGYYGLIFGEYVEVESLA